MPEVFQFIEFLAYKSAIESADAGEDEALWAAVRANQAYQAQHLNEQPERYDTGEAFLGLARPDIE